ncbi:MAG: SRPBCC family protein [Desulfobacteraceae bacterium]|jgi:hypothetical protein|nr:SRPBCC family protein [Desulfobacteraceae bacterium]
MIKITKNRISVGKFYPVSPLIVWDIITDTSQWPRWGPTVKNVQLSERYISTGSKGQVLTSLGVWLPFIIDEYEYGSFWSWKVATIKATGHRVQESEKGGSNLWFEIPMIAAPYTIVCQLALGRIENLLCEQKFRNTDVT